MAFTLLNPQPENLNAALNEIALELDDGTLVAVSVHPKWLPNNTGLTFEGLARHIEADGSDCLCGNGQPVQTTLNHTADLASVQKFTQPVIAREVMLALLGEPTTTEENQDGETVPLMAWSQELLDVANIRLAAQVALATGPQAIDPASVLGL